MSFQRSWNLDSPEVKGLTLGCSRPLGRTTQVSQPLCAVLGEVWCPQPSTITDSMWAQNFCPACEGITPSAEVFTASFVFLAHGSLLQGCGDWFKSFTQGRDWDWEIITYPAGFSLQMETILHSAWHVACVPSPKREGLVDNKWVETLMIIFREIKTTIYSSGLL